jgi:hypothetical protein
MHFLRKAAPYLYITGLTALAAGLPLWLLLISLSQFILLGAWLADGNIREKLNVALHNPVITVLTGIYFLHIAGLLFTTDFKYALDDLRVKLPLLILPLVIGTMPPLSKKHFDLVLKVLLASAFCSTLYSTLIWRGYTSRTVHNIRDISPLISHIRLSLIICMCLPVVIYLLRTEKKRIVQAGLYILALWFIIFLFILQSLTGICILLLMCIASLCFKAWSSRNAVIRSAAVLVTCCFIYGAFHLYQIIFVRSVRSINITSGMLLQKTKLGNPYHHDAGRQDEENGNAVWINICEAELDSAWHARSDIPYHGRDNAGQELRYTLIRFLASRNLLKDASGIDSLTDEEVKAIQAGIANVDYMHGSTLRTRLKQLAWEYRNYYYSGNPSGHSIMQRMEFWKTGLYIFRKHPFTGTGTGDLKEEYQKAYAETKSVLLKEFRLRAHNEYLTMFITFGVFGGLYFLFALIYPWFRMHKKNDLLYTCALAIILLSMVMEDTPESQAGATIFAFFNSFFLFHNYGRQLNS